MEMIAKVLSCINFFDMEIFIIFCVVTASVIDNVQAACGDKTPCPGSCQCDAKLVLVDCSNQNLLNIPDLPRATRTLSLASNSISQVQDSDFYGCNYLEELDLSHNRINRLTPGALKNVVQLRCLVLKDNLLNFNDNYSVPLGVFNDLTELSQLQIHNNAWHKCTKYREDLLKNKSKLNSLTLDSPPGVVPLPMEFSKLPLLESLAMYGGMHALHNTTLSSLGGLPLQEVRFIGSHLRFVDVLAFSPLTNLKLLDLSGNMNLGLGSNLTQAWASLVGKPIEKLYLRNISSYDTNDPTPPITKDFFYHLSDTPLVELYLDNNGLISVSANFSIYLPRLQKLSLSKNSMFLYIISLLNDIAVMPNLTYLDISDQSLFPGPFPVQAHSNDQNEWFSFIVFPPRFRVLNASSGLPMLAMRCSELMVMTAARHMDIIDISHNPVGAFTEDISVFPPHPMHVSLFNLSFCELHQIRVTRSEITLDTLDISNNNLGDVCALDKEGSFLNYTVVPLDVRNVRLSANRIKHLSPDFFSKCPSLEGVFINQNALRVWNSSLAYLPNITTLDLSDNLLSSLSVQTCAELTDIAEKRPFSINLRGNPLVCSCFTLYFLEWIDRHRDNVRDLNQTTCDFENDVTSLEDLTDIIHTLHIQCSSKVILIVVAVLLGLLIIMIFLSVVVYRHRWDIKYACLRLSRQRRDAQRLGNQDQYDFDAFVAYDHHDLAWVAQSLMTRLESSPHFLRVCVHHRNWLPGPTIEENISRSVEISRKTLVILTRNFIRSGWCELEMQLARMRGLEEGDDVIVVVALEEIALGEMSHTLVNLRRSNTWLDWYEYKNDQEQFWELLVHALGGSRLVRTYARDMSDENMPSLGHVSDELHDVASNDNQLSDRNIFPPM